MAAVLNWFLQGLVVAIAAGAALRLIPSSRTKARYGFIWAAYLDSAGVLPCRSVHHRTVA